MVYALRPLTTKRGHIVFKSQTMLNCMGHLSPEATHTHTDAHATSPSALNAQKIASRWSFTYPSTLGISLFHPQVRLGLAVPGVWESQVGSKQA